MKRNILNKWSKTRKCHGCKARVDCKRHICDDDYICEKCSSYGDNAECINQNPCSSYNLIRLNYNFRCYFNKKVNK